MKVLTDEQFNKVHHALSINRIMAQDANGDYSREVTPKIITEALQIMQDVKANEVEAQPERVPLSDAEIENVCVEVHLKRDFNTNLEKFVAIARAVEAAHEIKQGGQHD